MNRPMSNRVEQLLQAIDDTLKGAGKVSDSKEKDKEEGDEEEGKKGKDKKGKKLPPWMKK